MDGILLVLGYALVTLVGLMLLRLKFSVYCMRRGLNGPEPIAKRWALIMRGVEVVAGTLALYLLWGPVIHSSEPASRGSGLLLFVAWIYSIAVGYSFVLGALLAFLTVPGGNQMEYFRDRLSRIDWPRVR